MIQCWINAEERRIERLPGVVMLDVLRQDLGLVGVKEGCREGDCGACMVLLGEWREPGVLYRAVNACLLPLGSVAGRHVVTIEGLNQMAPCLSPLQAVFVSEGAAQCGFCTPGFIVALTGYCLSAPVCDLHAALEAVSGNICRCTGYIAIRRAIEQFCARTELRMAFDAAPGSQARTERLVALGLLPSYWADMAERLRPLRGDDTPPSPPASDAVLVAGGTDLLVQKADQLAAAPRLRLLAEESDLRGVFIQDGVCRIGAATPVVDVQRDEALRRAFPALQQVWPCISCAPVRARATVGGNLINASPIGDLTVLLLALDATLRLRLGHATRTVPLRRFYLAYKRMDLQPGECLTAIEFPLPPAGAVLTFEKVAKRSHLDIASVNSAAVISQVNRRIASAALAAGGVAPVPLFLEAASSLLTGRILDDAAIAAAVAAARAGCAPIGDVRGAAGYKRTLLGRLVRAQLTVAQEAGRA